MQRDGIDGPWSTFWVQVGTPSQPVSLLPGTSADALWIVLPEGCTRQDPTSCNQTRTVFNYNGSSSWHMIGTYNLGLSEESFLGYNQSADKAYFANETYTLGLPGSGLPTINNSVVEGFATKDFYMGLLGLSPQAINLTTITNPQPSLLQSLKESGEIQSLSWGYTAGSVGLENPVYGSLTLGGYDSSRFLFNNLSFPMTSGSSSGLELAIQSITTDAPNSATLLSNGVTAFIDTLVPELWLPEDTCTAFEHAFGISWDNDSQLYLLNDSVHNALSATNPNVTFELGVEKSGGNSVKITLPYSAFDLTVKPPRVSDQGLYFPLKRAQNSTQYTLGRTFLQSAYIIADYEHLNFSVSQALFPSGSVSQNLVPISASSFGEPNPLLPPSQPNPQGHSGLSGGAIAGIVIGVLAAIAALIALIWYFHKHSKKQTAQEKADDYVFPKVELDAQDTAIPVTTNQHHTQDSNFAGYFQNHKPELANDQIGELDSGMTSPAELGSDPGSRSRDVDPTQATELNGHDETPQHETPALTNAYFPVHTPTFGNPERAGGNPRVSELASTSEQSQTSGIIRGRDFSPAGNISPETRSDLGSLQERPISPEVHRASQATNELDSMHGRNLSTDGATASEPDSEVCERGRRVSPPISLSPNLTNYFPTISHDREPSPYITPPHEMTSDPFGISHFRQDSGEVAITPVIDGDSPNLGRDSHTN